jgi:hypothetical protein
MNQINCPLIELNDEVFAFVNKFNTDEELLRSGGLPTKMLDRLAFGFSEEEMKTIDPKDLNIKWKDDMLNVKWEQKQSGLSKKQWAEKINLSEPIDVIFEKNKFYIDDGHHRSYAALILNKPLNINLTIKTNPITKITPSLSYDQFHRCLFQQVKNMKLQEQINKMKIFNTLLEDKIKSESFQEFSKKRLDGATKITDNAKEKGGSALLTYHHFNVKLPYYKKAAEGNLDLETTKTEFKKLLDQLCNVTEDVKIDQIAFQKLVGKIEVLGELIIENKK